MPLCGALDLDRHVRALQSLGRRRGGVGDEDVGHAAAAPPFAAPRPYLGIKAAGKRKVAEGRVGGRTLNGPFPPLAEFPKVRFSRLAPPYAIPAIRFAAVTVFCSRQATVIRPTPPGTGVIAPATSLTAL